MGETEEAIITPADVDESNKCCEDNTSGCDPGIVPSAAAVAVNNTASNNNEESAVDAAVEDVAMQAAADAAADATGDDSEFPNSSKKKRLCRYPGCTRVIKSQGHCQRHGAKAKRCKVDGCEKQAQGTHDGMCKRHWKAIHFPDPPDKSSEPQPPPPEGESVYDNILPQSISYRPVNIAAAVAKLKPDVTKMDPLDPPPAPEGTNVMPLIAFLQEGLDKEAGWHRNAERRARGMFPASSLTSQLEPWERQLALVEILLLSGGTPYANFRALAHAWGRERGFHNLLANNVCERRGDIERKRRSDAGRTLTLEQKETFKQKLRKTRQFKTDRRSPKSADDDDDDDDDDDASNSNHQHHMDVVMNNDSATDEPPADLLQAASVEEMVDDDAGQAGISV